MISQFLIDFAWCLSLAIFISFKYIVIIVLFVWGIFGIRLELEKIRYEIKKLRKE